MKRLLIIPLALTLIVSAVACSRQDKRPNVLFLMLDTLRADHLSGYGYERQTSPVLDRFAQENLKASFAISAAPWTPASVASMLTGLYPTSHRMMPPNDRDIAKRGLAKLADSLDTMPEIFKGLGYKTAAVSPNPWITKEFGYAQGFDQFYFLEKKPASKIIESARKIFDGWAKDGGKDPFFLYLHFLDPHDPYEPLPGYDTKFTGNLTRSPFSYSPEMQRDINLYDGEINYLDTELGKLFEMLRERKLYDDLVIVIVSDHGEQFMEHGEVRHGRLLYNEEVHVPLMLKTGRAEDRGRVIDHTVSTVDILPTLLDLLGKERPQDLPGASLLRDEQLKGRKGLLSEVRRVYDMKSVTDTPGNRLIMQVPYDERDPDPMKSIEAWVSPKVIGVFDARNDYACKAPLQNKGLEARLSGAFGSIHNEALKVLVTPNKPGEEIKDETLEQLKSLGYLQ
ncbi:MAG: sulfatase [Pseudomonadota bacterium]